MKFIFFFVSTFIACLWVQANAGCGYMDSYKPGERLQIKYQCMALLCQENNHFKPESCDLKKCKDSEVLELRGFDIFKPYPECCDIRCVSRKSK